MELSFLRKRLLNTTFDAPVPNGTGPAQPMYAIKTTRGPFPFLSPSKTVIEYVGDRDAEKRHIAATIIWNWPSQARSYIHINGKLMSLSEFMPLAPGFMNTDSYVRIGNDAYMWRSVDFEPQLYDGLGRRVVSYTREPFSVSLRSSGPRANISIIPEIANDPVKRDVAIASLFLFKFCRDIAVPWQRKKNAPVPAPRWVDEYASVGTTEGEVQAFAEVKDEVKDEKRKAGDKLGDYTRLPDEETEKA